MDHPFIPTYSYWANNNSWYGSFGMARFFIKPTKPEEGQENAPNFLLNLQLWRGPLAMDKSEILEEVTFPLTEGQEEADLQALALWVEEKAAQLA